MVLLIRAWPTCLGIDWLSASVGVIGLTGSRVSHPLAGQPRHDFMVLSEGRNQSESQCPGALQASACIMSANILSAKVSCMVEPRDRAGERALRFTEERI